MKERTEKELLQEKDRHLDVPSEANRDKHINFMEVEEESAQTDRRHRDDDTTEERRRQWEQGLQEGKEVREGRERE